MRTAHALSPAARACAHSSGAWQPTRRSASLRHGPGRRNSLRQAPGLPRELPRDCPPRSPRTRINAPASDRLSRSALTTRTTASALRQRSSRHCSVQKGSFLSARAPAPAPPLKRPPPAATLRCSDRRGAPTRAATPRLLQWTKFSSEATRPTGEPACAGPHDRVRGVAIVRHQTEAGKCLVAIGIAGLRPVGTIALEECNRRAAGTVRPSCTAAFGR